MNIINYRLCLLFVFLNKKNLARLEKNGFYQNYEKNNPAILDKTDLTKNNVARLETMHFTKIMVLD